MSDVGEFERYKDIICSGEQNTGIKSMKMTITVFTGL